MTFNITGLGLETRQVITELTPKILMACTKAQTQLDAGHGTIQVTRWFGATAIRVVRTKVGKLRSFFNLNSITLEFSDLANRGTVVAAAFAPSGGWDDYTDVTKASHTSFRMYLDSAWDLKPTWSTLPLQHAGRGGKFKTLVHELSHMGLNTNDHVYGATLCVTLASTDPAQALDNADNWGFFVEEFAH